MRPPCIPNPVVQRALPAEPGYRLPIKAPDVPRYLRSFEVFCPKRRTCRGLCYSQPDTRSTSKTSRPDRAGGLGFLGAISYAFGPVLFGQGAMLAGLIASRVLYHGDSLLSFRLQAGSFVVFFVCVVFAPLIMFTAPMARAGRKGLADYGLLAQRYVEGLSDCQ